MLENARAKRAAKNADLLVANDVSRADAGFASDHNAAVLIDAEAETRAAAPEQARAGRPHLGPGAGAALAATPRPRQRAARPARRK